MHRRVITVFRGAPAFLLRAAVTFIMIKLNISFVFGLIFGHIKNRAVRGVMVGIYAVVSVFYFLMLADGLAALEGTSFLEEAPSPGDIWYVLSFDLGAFLVGVGAASLYRRLGDRCLPHTPLKERYLLGLVVCLALAAVVDRCNVSERDPQRIMVRVGQALDGSNPEQVAEFNKAIQAYIHSLNDQARR
jgi:multisubunit Na+/H+ antiporter MnhE subunit